MATLLDPQALEAELTRMPGVDVAARLQDILGQKSTAYLAGINDPKMVGRWIKKGEVPEARARQLRCALHVIRILDGAYDLETAKAWLWGSNSRLGHDAPAYAIRHARDGDDLQPLVPAAIAFVSDAG